MTRYGLTTIMKTEDLSEQAFGGCLEASLRALSHYGTVQEDTLLVDGRLKGLWLDKLLMCSPESSTRASYNEFAPEECVSAHGIENYDVPHYHLNVSAEVEA